MQVTVLGTGSVARSLAAELKRRPGIDLVQIAGRNRSKVKRLAAALQCKSAFTPSDLMIHDGMYIVAVSDDAISAVIRRWCKPTGIWVHTSGSTDVNVFRGYTPRFGVLYPAMSVNPMTTRTWKKIPVLLEANNRAVLQLLRSFCKRFCGPVYSIPSDDRAIIHLAAVFLNNFIHHLSDEAFRLLMERNIKPEVLIPLAEATAGQLGSGYSPDTLTGPARRNDRSIISKHLTLLGHKPELKNIYRAVTASIIKRYHSSRIEKPKS